MTAHNSTATIIHTVLVVSLLILFAFALSQALDTDQAKANVQVSASQSLAIGTTDQIGSLDPAQSYDFHSWEILLNIGSGLLTYIAGTTELTPGLATAMPDVSPDGRVYTFTLRSGLSFPDGAPLDASAVKWSIDRVAALGGGPSWFVTEFVSEVHVVDSTTIEFVLEEASHLFPHVVASTPYLPVSPSCFPGDQFDPDSTCGGLGRYTIAEWTPGASMTLDANAGYPGLQPKTPSITVRYYDNAATLRQALEDGELDIAWKTLTPTDYDELEADPNFSLVKGGTGYIRYLCFNTTTEPFDSAVVRTAIAAAVDRESTARGVYTDTMSALYSMVPQGMWSHIDAFRDRYGQRDLPQARALLQQAGYSEVSKLELHLWYPLERYGPQEADLAARLEAQIEETGLVSVTVHSETWSNYWSNLGAGTMPVFLLGWYPDYPDPDNYTWPFAHSTSSGGLGIFYDNGQMDDLLEAGRSTAPVQGAARTAIYEEIQELWADEAPTVPLLQGSQVAVTVNGIRGVTISPLGTLPFFTIWDARVSATIDPDGGGSLTSDDGNTTLQFPAGAVTSTVVVTYTPLSDVQPWGNLNSIGKVFGLTAVYSDTGQAARVALGHTYTVTVHYASTEIGPTISEDTLGLYWWDEGASSWTQQGISSSVNTAENVVTAQVDHFSRFAVLGEPHRVYLPLVTRRQ